MAGHKQREPFWKKFLLIGVMIVLFGANAAAIQLAAHWMGWTPSVLDLPVSGKLFILIVVPFVLVEVVLLSFWVDIGLNIGRDELGETATQSESDSSGSRQEEPGVYEDQTLSQWLYCAVGFWIIGAVIAGGIAYSLIFDPEILTQQSLSALVPMYAVCVLILAGAVGSSFYVRHRSRWIDYVLSQDKTTDGKFDFRGWYYVWFTYQVNGEAFRSRQIYRGRTFEFGQAVTVRYDDRNPKRALID